jgi:hypothetical protein
MRIAMVFDEKLGPGLLANAAACIASGLFNEENGLLGPQIQGADFTCIPITKIPCLILKQNGKPWRELLSRAQKNKLKHMVFTREGQSTTSYDEYVKRVEGKPLEDVDVIGIGVLGEDQLVTKFSGDLPLLR